MEKENISIKDWDRILFGEAPPLYLLEVVVRVAFVYLIILLAIRLMGKRMIAKVGRSDVVARVSLAAAVGLPIQRPGRGLLVALVIVVIIVGVGRFLAWLSSKKRSAEKAIQGIHAPLVKDGIIDTARIDKVHVTRERLFAALRAENIRHLGQVERLYMEANGAFSLVKKNEAGPGLSVVPEWDIEMRERQERSDLSACYNCGKIYEARPETCQHCHHRSFENAVGIAKD